MLNHVSKRGHLSHDKEHEDELDPSTRELLP